MRWGTEELCLNSTNWLLKLKTTYKKIHIAEEYLNDAIQLYFAGKYFSAIHLAAAATELFEGHLPPPSGILNLTVKAQKAFEYCETGKAPKDADAKRIINHEKNAIKHMDSVSDSEVNIDSQSMAIFWIENALSNHRKLGLGQSKNIWKFEDEQSCLRHTL